LFSTKAMSMMPLTKALTEEFKPILNVPWLLHLVSALFGFYVVVGTVFPVKIL
jgi:hypothetical protein